MAKSKSRPLAHPAFISAGRVTKKIEVGLSYRIVELFSEGLYASANKAFEELITNSFDAGALHVNVILPADPTAKGASIVVVDDGEGMNTVGLEELWQIGATQKRKRTNLPHGRSQIGKFGIGKLATYVLANKLTYISKKGRKYYATTMDYTRLDTAAATGVVAQRPIQLDVRELSANEAKAAVENWLSNLAFQEWKVPLFGRGAPKSWVFAILSSLKDKANEIEPGRLEWILRTALPLRDDFSIHLNGKRLTPSKSGKGRIKKWILGKDIKELSKPAPEGLAVRSDLRLKSSDELHYGLYHPTLGRITGYAEGYRDVLTTGKAGEVGRSYGFFVYVLGRLINIEDEYFGIDSNLLRHGTFARFRLVIHIDRLDHELQSAREGVRDGPISNTARNLLHAIFNYVRPKIEQSNLDESPGKRIARKVAGSPASLSRRPIVDLAKLALSGKARPKYTVVPMDLDESKHEEFIEKLAERAENPEEFIKSVELSYSLSTDDGIALYDVDHSTLQINALHPFVGAFSDDYQSRNKSLSLELLAMAEVLLEAQLYHHGHRSNVVNEIISTRDELLRSLVRGSGRRTALMISEDLRNARNDPNLLEQELCAAFEKLGFDVVKIGGPNKPDGKASAHLGVDEDGTLKRYAVSLEAKSKERMGGKVSAKSVNISGIIRQRNDFKCQHAIVVGPDFPSSKRLTSDHEASALEKEILEDRKKYRDNKEFDRRTITLMRIDDLAKLVRLAPVKQINPSRLRRLFLECSTPEESSRWVEAIAIEKPSKPPYKAILEEIWDQQQVDPSSLVEYAALRVGLSKRAKPISRTNTELRDLCVAMSAMAPAFVSAREDSVELEVNPKKVLEEIKAATDDYPADDHL
ncbi:MAG: ATP-binding protein [Kiloniellaceae bacterium]